MKNCKSNAKNGINLDYDYNTEYGDGDIPEADKNCSKNGCNNHTSNCSHGYKNVSPDEVPRRDGSGGQ